MSTLQQKPRSLWWFLLPLLFQTVLVLSIPAQAFYTRLIGTTVILQTIPVDPYDLLRGYSQTLRYEISRTENLRNLPGWDGLPDAAKSPNGSLQPGTELYVILEAPNESARETSPPTPWKLVSISPKRPKSLPSDRIAIRGEADYSSVEYGLERYYMPEDQREEINRQIRQLANPRNERPFVVEIKVDPQGNAVPISLWIGDRNYRF
jgi:uncharacterized membrane-anchored protein